MSDHGAGSAAKYVVRDTVSSLIDVILQWNLSLSPLLIQSSTRTYTLVSLHLARTLDGWQ